MCADTRAAAAARAVAALGGRTSGRRVDLDRCGVGATATTTAPAASAAARATARAVGGSGGRHRRRKRHARRVKVARQQIICQGKQSVKWACESYELGQRLHVNLGRGGRFGLLLAHAQMPTAELMIVNQAVSDANEPLASGRCLEAMREAEGYGRCSYT